MTVRGFCASRSVFPTNGTWPGISSSAGRAGVTDPCVGGHSRTWCSVITGIRARRVPYFALASGFLTGKYRPGKPVESVRDLPGGYADTERGAKVLAALDDVASAHGVENR